MSNQPRSCCPELTPVRFLILSTLTDGGERTAGEICEETAWQTSRPNFWRITKGMIRAGLLKKSAVTLQNGKTEVRFAITRPGLNAWQEFLDFAVFIAERHATKRPETIPVVQRRPARIRKPSAHRLMTATEQQRFFRCCNAALRRLVIASRDLPELSLEEITGLDVGAFDAGTGELIHGQRRLPVSRELERAIREAIGKRKAGPLLCSHRGRRWSVNSAGTAFKRARRKAGIAGDVVLRGSVYRKAS